MTNYRYTQYMYNRLWQLIGTLIVSCIEDLRRMLTTLTVRLHILLCTKNATPLVDTVP
jgi:hypothetical protein